MVSEFTSNEPVLITSAPVHPDWAWVRGDWKRLLAFGFGSGLEALDVELRAGLRQVRGNHGDLGCREGGGREGGDGEGGKRGAPEGAGEMDGHVNSLLGAIRTGSRDPERGGRERRIARSLPQRRTI